MLKRTSFLFIFLLVSMTGFSQFNQNARHRRDSIRAEYIEEFPDDFSIWPMLKYRALAFSIDDKKQKQPTVTFNPNNDFKAGAGFYLFDISFEVSFSVPIAVRDEAIYGKSKSTDLQINALTKSVGLDLYYQKYTGFFKDDEAVKIPSGEAYPLRPDIITRNFGLSAFYVWNNKKFSIRSSYNYADRQVKSAGSFILYGTINSFSLEADSSILSTANQSTLGEGSDFEHLRYTTFSLAPGYSYNLVLKRVYFNGTFAIGPAHHWVYFQPETGRGHHDIVFNSTYTLRIAAGYSGHRFFTGAGLVLQSRVVKFEEIRFENSTSVFRLVVGYRFKEKGFLKKKLL
jgi:Domain of unknown function (DUF4421)